MSSTHISSPTGWYSPPYAVGDPTRIMAGTDCGFKTSTGTGMVAPSLVWRKLAALSEGSALATTRLFG